MRFVSLCSGIEAATMAWAPLGWEPLWYSEIDPHACAVLEARHPGVPNLGDMTEIDASEYRGSVDVVVGGTPCQSFSVAGLRKGLDDDRGVLTLEFLRLIGEIRPKWVVWENVPGVLSLDGGQTLTDILSIFERQGYICDIDILDAQFFGVAQRRKRVFVCGVHRDHLLQRTTPSSALITAQCLVEILHGIWAAASASSASGPVASGSNAPSVDGVRRRMTLFGITGRAGCSLPLLQRHLDVLWKPRDGGRATSGPRSSGVAGERTPVVPSTDSGTGAPFTLTAESWRENWAGACEAMRSFITSTATRETTDRTISTCSRAVLSIAALILRSKPLCPPYWSAASSTLIALQDAIGYARQASSNLFTDPRWVPDWHDFCRQAPPFAGALGRIGIRSFGQVFSLSESLSGHPAPRREAGKEVAALTKCGVGTCGADDNQAQAGHPVEAFGGGRTRGPIPVSTALTAHGQRICFESETFIVADPLTTRPYADSAAQEGKLVAFSANERTHKDATDEGVSPTLRGDNRIGVAHDASEDGTGRGTPIVEVSAIQERAVSEKDGQGPQGRGHSEGGAAYTMESRHTPQAVAISFNPTQDPISSEEHTDPVSREPPAIAVSLRGRDGGSVAEVGGDVSPALRSAQGGSDKQHVMPSRSSVVRRITPREAERLMGFPDDYTRVEFRGKRMADGPRYRLLGNSMVVNVMSWIGQMIRMIEEGR